MYLHIGGDVTISLKSIISIMDMENTTISKITKDFLRKNEENNNIINISEDLPKSYVICNEDDVNTVYVSPISSATLLKRANSYKEMLNDYNYDGQEEK